MRVDPAFMDYGGAMSRRLHSAWRLAAAGAAAMLIISACGSDDDGGDTSDEPEAGATEESPMTEGDGTLTLGTLLPQTGDLAFLGPPEFAGVDLAVQDINEAGGVLGQQVAQVRADSGDNTPKIAPGSVDRLLNEDADVIIGAASSDVSLSVIDKITTAGVVQFSPANTSTVFDSAEYDPNELYFRTAPSDVLQGEVLGNLVVKDGAQNVAILARQDAYGEALADNTEKAIVEQGAEVSENILYAADAQQFTSEVQQIAAANPDAIVLITFNELTKILPRLVAAGIGPTDVPTYLVDGNCADYSQAGESPMPAGILGKSKCTYPGAELTNEFRERLLTVNPNLKDFTYGPESYDAAILAALAATAAGSDAGEAVASELINVTRDGDKCTEYAECVQMIEDGADIDYEGVSGPTDMNDFGSPSKATIGIFQYSPDNTYANIDYITGVVE
jgi:ABC-type branched-subunit amino acid transport system substrate-binding protein